MEDETLDGGDRHAKLSREARTLDRGDLVGRYVVLRRLGVGGMGVVYAAYDPELDRKLAIKLLLPGSRSASRTDGPGRLLREAQALARLDHPNIVSIHDVGTFEEQVFLAMEFVEGVTLGAWLEKERRPWRAVLTSFQQAGRGLAAAHAKGLIHRDFKPDNVMVGDDGRIRVMDFGLARAHQAPTEKSPPELPEEAQTKPPRDALSTELTQLGAVIGTPAYMAPEQHLGLPTDARTDQFSFCVALWEALFGERPFAGETPSALAMSVTEGTRRPAPKDSDVPRWLRRACERGLSTGPDDRWPSMTDLLTALSHDPSKARRYWMAGAGVLVVVGTVGYSASITDSAAADLCGDFDENLIGVWDDDQRESVREALIGTGLAYAEDTATRVEERVDEWARDWVKHRTDACEATHVRGEQSEAALDLRMTCLDEKLDSLRAVVGVLEDADVKLVEKAVGMVARLPGLDRCDDLTALQARVAPPEDPVIAERVRQIREAIARARALDEAGRAEDSLAIALEQARSARTLDYEPILAEALERLGQSYYSTGNYDDAENTQIEAFQLAIASRMDEIAAFTAASLAMTVGYRLARHDEGKVWAIQAEALARAEGYSAARQAALNALGGIELAKGNYTEARKYREQALAEVQETRPDDVPSIAGALFNLGNVAMSSRDFDAAADYFERALTLFERSLGPEHPLNAYGLMARANVLEESGDLESARADLEQAISIQKAVLPPDHVDLAFSLHNLGRVTRRDGDPRAGADLQRRALSIWEKGLGPDNPLLAHALVELGDCLRELHEYEGALKQLERALTLRTSQEVAPADLASTKASLAKVLYEAPAEVGGNEERARSLALEARSTYESLGEGYADPLRETDEWLAQHE